MIVSSEVLATIVLIAMFIFVGLINYWKHQEKMLQIRYQKSLEESGRTVLKNNTPLWSSFTTTKTIKE